MSSWWAVFLGTIATLTALVLIGSRYLTSSTRRRAARATRDHPANDNWDTVPTGERRRSMREAAENIAARFHEAGVPVRDDPIAELAEIMRNPASREKR